MNGLCLFHWGLGDGTNFLDSISPIWSVPGHCTRFPDPNHTHLYSSLAIYFVDICRRDFSVSARRRLG